MKFYANRLFLHAKVHAIKENLFCRDDYVKLINSGSIRSIFHEIISDTIEKDYIRVKEVIFRHHIENLFVLIDATDFYHGFYKLFLAVFELNNIKLIISKAFGRDVLIQQWYDIHPYDSVSNKILSAEISKQDIPGIFQNSYIDSDLFTLPLPEYESLVFMIEMNLLQEILRISKKTNENDQNILYKIIAIKLIAIKKIWDLRIQQPVNLHDNQRQDQFDFIQHFFSEFKTFKKIFLKTEPEIDTEIHQIRQSHNNQADITAIEFGLSRYLYMYLQTVFNKNFSSINSILCYTWLISFQIQNINTIIEGFRFSITHETIQKKIVCEE